MTRIFFRLRGQVVETVTPKDWTEALEIIGRAFYPLDTPSGPELPKPEPKR
jgi:hypothetical protein